MTLLILFWTAVYAIGFCLTVAYFEAFVGGFDTASDLGIALVWPIFWPFCAVAILGTALVHVGVLLGQKVRSRSSSADPAGGAKP